MGVCGREGERERERELTVNCGADAVRTVKLDGFSDGLGKPNVKH